MCGRFSFVASKEKLKKQFNVLAKTELHQSYNITPLQHAYVVTNLSPELQYFRWGLIPHWANDERVGNNLNNARADGIETKPSFRLPIRHKRCVVFADSFYEWRNLGKAMKQPFRILPENNGLIAMAGVWDLWQNPLNGELFKTFAVITTEPNAEMEPIHNRMPVMFFNEEQVQNWLNEAPLPKVLELLVPPANGLLRTYPVSDLVNKAENNSPALHNPVEKIKTLFD